MTDPVEIWIGANKLWDHAPYRMAASACEAKMHEWGKSFADPLECMTGITSCWSSKSADGSSIHPEAGYNDAYCFKDCREVSPGLFFGRTGGTPVYVNTLDGRTMVMAKTRTFRVKYDNWPIRDTNVAVATLTGLDDDATVRKVMGTAFEQQLKGEWPDAPGRKIVLTKSDGGMWEGTRTREDGRVQEWFVMETTEN